MNTTPILATTFAKFAAVAVAVAAPAMLFLGAGSATATGHPGGGPDDPETSSSVSHPDFDWRPIAPAVRPGSPRTAPASSAPKSRHVSYPEPQIRGFEPETF